MRVMVTGASGLLGSQLAALLEADHQVIRWQANLLREIDLDALPANLDAVFYLAQSRRFREFPEAAGDVARINTLAAVELAQHALRAGARHFVYASTGGIYAPSSEPLGEEAPIMDPGTMGFYAASKLAAERLLAPFAGEFNLIILRPFFIYGNGQDRSMLLPRIADHIRAGRPVRLAGRDGLRINPIHATDAARAFRNTLALNCSQTINVAGPEELSLRAIAEAIAAHLACEAHFNEEPEAAADLVGDIARMSELLGRPSIRFVDRIDEVAG